MTNLALTAPSDVDSFDLTAVVTTPKLKGAGYRFEAVQGGCKWVYVTPGEEDEYSRGTFRELSEAMRDAARDWQWGGVIRCHLASKLNKLADEAQRAEAVAEAASRRGRRRAIRNARWRP